MEPVSTVFQLEGVRSDLDNYKKVSKACLSQLVNLWRDLELSFEDQAKEVHSIIERSHSVWTEAVQFVESQRKDLHESLEEDLKEIYKIKQQLGDDIAQNEEDIVSLSSDEQRTLRRTCNEVQANLTHWKDRKAQRVKEYEALQSQIRILRAQVDQVAPSSPQHPDISRAGLEFQKLEVEKLSAEKERRRRALEGLLDKLHVVCSELGEDDKFAAAEVHPTLIYAWDKESQHVLDSVSKLTGCLEATDPSRQVNLSCRTFDGLERKIGQMYQLKSERENQGRELMGVLHSLWDALDIPADASERTSFDRLHQGPYRLHAKSIEKCMSEVARLEGCKAQLMKDLVHGKAKELQDLCAATHITAPDLRQLVADMGRNNNNTGVLAESLAKLVRMLAEVQVMAEKRRSIVVMIDQLEEARREVAWLRSYENDANRYKGRDSSKNLNRSIKAGKVRERLPSMVEKVRIAMQEWELMEGSAFMYDGRSYADEELTAVVTELDQMALEKQAAAEKVKERRQSLAQGPTSRTMVNTPGHHLTPKHAPGRAQLQKANSTTGSLAEAVVPQGLNPRLSVNVHNARALASSHDFGANTPSGRTGVSGKTPKVSTPFHQPGAKTNSPLGAYASITPENIHQTLQKILGENSNMLTSKEMSGRPSGGFPTPQVLCLELDDEQIEAASDVPEIVDSPRKTHPLRMSKDQGMLSCPTPKSRLPHAPT